LINETLHRDDRFIGMPRRSPALLLVHVVWATVRRAALLDAAMDERLIAIAGAKASQIGCVLLAAGCAPDHMHAVFDLSACVRLADLVQRVKGASAYEINRPPFAPRPIRWQRGYWAESVGIADLDPLGRYVRSQRVRHDESHPAERWQFSEQGEPAREGGL
jgi:REP element-mobilizing transposase RayT